MNDGPQVYDITCHACDIPVISQWTAATTMVSWCPACGTHVEVTVPL